ncbi:MAG: SOS response-associated peptidase [Actinobacteria bacterium]|nr:SOS response-associated peptidase [Actinomycetota bacterium]
MCGRYVVARTLSGALPDLLENLEGWNPDFENYNIPPTAQVPVVVEQPDATTGVVQRIVDWAHWGFVPAWKKSFAERPQPVNARIEGVATNGMFREAFRHRHCIVPASGYFEWSVNAAGEKQPYYIRGSGGRGLAMAGLFEDWIDPAVPEGEPGHVRRTTTIITRSALESIIPIHDRMPVLLGPETYDAWLTGDFASAAESLNFLETAAQATAQTFEAYAVGAAVGNVRNHGAQLIEPLAT